MNKANECTCPSGDGSLVHPCPAHPAVEQVGGDERAAFEAAFAAMGRPVCRADYDQDAYGTPFDDGGWTGWQARAALAQPSPVRSSLLINGYQLRAALDFIAPDGTAEQLESEACIEWRQQDADFLEAGLYAFCAEYPEEGGVLLDEEPTTAQPSPLQSDQAEAERPEGPTEDELEAAGLGYPLHKEEAVKLWYSGFRSEVITVLEAWEAIGHDIGMNPDKGELLDSLRYMLEKCEAHDAALARVAELEGKLTDWVHEGFRLNEALAVAKAQHSVPELLEWAVGRWHAEVSLRPLINVHRRALDDTWRQVIRRLGGDTGLLCGPSHDE
ncbi:TPA: hypothetical protein SMN94_006520, partial [Pseudomonas aeruginosa]|nr:hypothetical protein [Pseudomonas aeruginosa]